MKKLMEKVINELTDHKAEADLIYSSSKSLSLKVNAGKISEYKVSSSEILGVRAIKDGKVGISYTEAFDDESLKFMIKQALSNAEMSGAQPAEKILNLTGTLTDEMTYPEDEIDINVKVAKTIELESKVKSGDPRVVTVPWNGYSENEFTSEYLSSRGRSTSYKDKTYSIATSALMDEKGKKANYYDSNIAHKFNELKWDDVINNSLFHAKNLLGSKTIPNGKYQVRFDEDCLRDLLSCFSNFYSAKASMDKVNPWSAKLGTQVMSQDLTLIDEPLYEKSFRTSKFDSEGVERKTLTLVKDGELKSFYHNSVTANHFGTTTTGHASRGPASSIGVSGTHVLVKGKNKKPLPHKYIEVIDMAGLYSGANRVTGDFSVGIKGYVWENGERKTSFENMTLSGNLMEILNRVDVVGDELLPSQDLSFFSVPLIFHDLSVAGS